MSTEGNGALRHRGAPPARITGLETNERLSHRTGTNSRHDAYTRLEVPDMIQTRSNTPRLAPFALSLLVLSLSLLALPAAAETINESTSHRFDAGPETRLVLRHGDGDVEIEAWDEDAIEVDVTYIREEKRIGLGGRSSFTVAFEERGDTRYVIGKEKKASGIGVFSSSRYEHVYRIRAPRHITLDLEGDDGNIEITGWHGDISIDLDDGDIDLREVDAARTRVEMQDGDAMIAGLRGDLTLTADDGDVTIRDCDSERLEIDLEDGDVEVNRCRGHLTISTDDGDIELANIHATALDIETSDGDVEAELLGNQRLDARFTTDDGGVRLTVSDDLRAAFTITMDDGRVDVDVPGAEVQTGKHRVSGILGGNATGTQGEIQVDTNDGRVSLRGMR